MAICHKVLLKFVIQYFIQHTDTN